MVKAMVTAIVKAAVTAMFIELVVLYASTGGGWWHGLGKSFTSKLFFPINC